MAEIANPIMQKLDLMLLGDGFNFYRAENRLRADDLLVRQKACTPLGDAARRFGELAIEFQNKHIPAPTRDQPYPPADLTAVLRRLTELRSRISNMAARIQGLPAPTQDRIWRRFRSEHGLLEQLLASDVDMLEISGQIGRLTAALTCPELKNAAALTTISNTLDQLDVTCNRRRSLLEIPG